MAKTEPMEPSIQGQLRSTQSPTEENASSSTIVGELHLKTGHFWVIALNESSPTDYSLLSPNKSLDQGLELGYLEFFRFEIEGNYYAIIKCIDDKNDDLHFAELLSGRELQIVTLVAQGHANKQIAKRLKISEWTVSEYLRRVFAKLNVDSRAAMVYKCAPLIQKLQTLRNI